MGKKKIYTTKSKALDITPKTGAVALLDILGFKGLWGKESPESIITKLYDIQKVAKAELRGAKIMLKDFSSEHDYKMLSSPEIQYFSDTFVITVEEGENDGEGEWIDSITFIALLVNNLLNKSIDKGFLLRGAISYGTFYLPKANMMILGPAIDECAEWYEKGDWAGIHTTPSAQYKIEYIRIKKEIEDEVEAITSGEQLEVDTEPIEDKGAIWVKYAIPLKDKQGHTSKLETYALNWPIMMPLETPKGIDILDPRQEELKRIKIKRVKVEIVELFSKQPLGPINAINERKYKNTIDFLDFLQQ